MKSVIVVLLVIVVAANAAPCDKPPSDKPCDTCLLGGLLDGAVELVGNLLGQNTPDDSNDCVDEVTVGDCRRVDCSNGGGSRGCAVSEDDGCVKSSWGGDYSNGGGYEGGSWGCAVPENGCARPNWGGDCSKDVGYEGGSYRYDVSPGCGNADSSGGHYFSEGWVNEDSSGEDECSEEEEDDSDNGDASEGSGGLDCGCDKGEKPVCEKMEICQ